MCLIKFSKNSKFYLKQLVQFGWGAQQKTPITITKLVTGCVQAKMAPEVPSNDIMLDAERMAEWDSMSITPRGK